MSFEEIYKYGGMDFEFKFEFDVGVPSRIFLASISSVEKTIYKNLLDILSDCCKELKNDYSINDKELYAGFEKLKGHALLITGARNGSIVIEACVASLCVWVLANTIGESFKEAWKESKSNQRLKDLLNYSLLNRREIIQSSIQSELQEKLTHPEGSYSISYSISENPGDAGKIHINIMQQDKTRIEALGKGYDGN